MGDEKTVDRLKQAFQSEPREPQFRGLEVTVWKFLCSELDTLRAEVVELRERVARLEAGADDGR